MIIAINRVRLMIYTEPAMKIRQNLGEILNKVQYHHDSILITKANRPIAAIVDIELFDKICQMKIEFDSLSAKLAKTYQDVDASTAEAEISEALISVRKKSEE